MRYAIAIPGERAAAIPGFTTNVVVWVYCGDEVECSHVAFRQADLRRSSLCSSVKVVAFRSGFVRVSRVHDLLPVEKLRMYNIVRCVYVVGVRVLVVAFVL